MASLPASVILFFLGQATPQEFIPNGGFDSGFDGWTNYAAGEDQVISEWLPKGGRSGGGGLRIRSTRGGERANWVWGCGIRNPPQGKRLRFTAWVKGKGVATHAGFFVDVWEGPKPVGFETSQARQPLNGDFDWTKVEFTTEVPAEADYLRVNLLLHGKGEVWFDDVSAQVSDRFSRHALYDVKGETEVEARGVAKNPTLLVPMPLSYQGQNPLTFSLSTVPGDALSLCRVFEDKPGNYVAEVKLRTLEAGESVRVIWSSIVLVEPRGFDALPKEALLPDTWPEDVRPWLRSSRCCQSTHERIRKVASDVRGESSDVREILQKTVDRLGAIYNSYRPGAGFPAELDAVGALDLPGSCTSAANLATALLRANGIPARIVAGYATWFGPHQTHYLVEAYVPRFGWYPLEPTKLKLGTHPHEQINVSIVPTEYEDRSAVRPFAAGGVPYLSLNETKEFDDSYVAYGILGDQRGLAHVAKFRQGFPESVSEEEWAATVERARSRWKSWLNSGPSADDNGRVETSFQAAEGKPMSYADLRRSLKVR